MEKRSYISSVSSIDLDETEDFTARRSTLGQRIYSLSGGVGSEETLSTNPSTFVSKPQTQQPVPRMRILLAPYMSPYVVPVHQVQTWSKLQRTIQSLFGSDLDSSRVRITDYKGNTILARVWNEVLEPNMTIIVDTCSYISEDSPSIFRNTRPFFHDRQKSGPDDDGYTSVTAMVLAERESEDSSYDSANVIGPLGQVGNIAALAPPNSLKTRPMPAWEGWKTPEIPPDDKRYTSVTMFAGGQRRTIAPEKRPVLEDVFANPSPAVERIPEPEPKDEPRKPMSERLPIMNMNMVPRGTSSTTITAAVATEKKEEQRQRSRSRSAHKERPSSRQSRRQSILMKKKSGGWSKIAKALKFILSAGTAGKDRSQSKLRRSASSALPRRTPSTRNTAARNPTRNTTHESTSLNARFPPRKDSLTHANQPTIPRKPSLASRRGVASLEPLHKVSESPEQQFTRSPGRSKSLGTLWPSNSPGPTIEATSRPYRGHRTAASASSPPVSEIRRSSSRSRADSGVSLPSAGHRRTPSRSLSNLRKHSQTTSALARKDPHSRTQSAASPPSRKESRRKETEHERHERQASAITITPPIPKRPKEDLGTSAQFKTPLMGRDQIVRMAEGTSQGGRWVHAKEFDPEPGVVEASLNSNKRGKGPENSREKLGSRGGSRDGSRGDSRDESSSTGEKARKQTRPQYTYSPFPPASPPRSPFEVVKIPAEGITLPEADRRPEGTRRIFGDGGLNIRS